MDKQPAPYQEPDNEPQPARSLSQAGRGTFFTTPLSRQGWPVWAVYLAALVGLVYLLNPGLGVFELLPDNLPVVGNLDEGLAFMLAWYGLLEFFEGKRNPPPQP